MNRENPKNEPLAKELATYDRLLPSLLPDEGRFVLIVGDEKIDVFVSQEDALKAGYRKAGLAPFLVKRISGTESAMYFSRDLAASCPTIHSQ